MLHADIPLSDKKPNRHNMPTECNANPQNTVWEQQHIAEAKSSLPWRSPMFWAGVTSSIGVTGMILWTIWSGVTGIAKSDWVVKPAKDSEFHFEVKDLRESITRVEQRVERVEQRVDGNAVRTDAKLDHITDLLIIQGGPKK